jgi:hypothetical protein
VIEEPEPLAEFVAEGFEERVLDPVGAAERVGLWDGVFVPVDVLGGVREFAVDVPWEHGPAAVGAAPEEVVVGDIVDWGAPVADGDVVEGGVDVEA